MSAPHIRSAVIGLHPHPFPEQALSPLPTVTATFDDGSTKELFAFCPDILSFTEREFIGLTEAEAQALRIRKDIELLRS